MPSLHDPRVLQSPLDEEQRPNMCRFARTVYTRLESMKRCVDRVQRRLDGQPRSYVFAKQT